MNINNLRRLALELLRRQPAAFADLVNGELPEQMVNKNQSQMMVPQNGVRVGIVL